MNTKREREQAIADLRPLIPVGSVVYGTASERTGSTAHVCLWTIGGPDGRPSLITREASLATGLLFDPNRGTIKQPQATAGLSPVEHVIRILAHALYGDPQALVAWSVWG